MPVLHVKCTPIPAYPEHCSIAIGTLFHVNWNGVPYHLEYYSNLYGTEVPKCCTSLRIQKLMNEGLLVDVRFVVRCGLGKVYLHLSS